jgi:hypothetical protein
LTSVAGPLYEWSQEEECPIRAAQATLLVQRS